jgi:CBS domain-containing protein
VGRLAVYRAEDVMTKNVISVDRDDTVEHAIRTLLEHRISGAPVTDRSGSLVGIISEFQLLEVIYEPELRSAPVSRLMTKDVLTVDEQATLSDVASLFVVHRIRRAPVVRDGRVVGLISRRDLLRYVLDAAEGVAEFVNVTRGALG